MNESVKKSVGAERPHCYGERKYKAVYYNSNHDAGWDDRMHQLLFTSSATEPKHLADIAVRKAKEHNWQWTSFLVYDDMNNIASKRVARKPKK